MPRINATLVALALATLARAAAAQGWGPPPPEAPTAPPAEETAPAEAAAPEDETARLEVPPEPTPEAAAPDEPALPPAAAPPATDEPAGEPEPDEALPGPATPAERGSGALRAVRRLFQRFELHGYARMPLNLHARPLREGEETADIGREVPFRLRSPFLVDNDYYLSGFAYTRLYETDWAELFFSTGNDDVDITIGMFASLFSDWAYVSTKDQWGIAQASVTWRRVAGIEPLSIQAGMFWDRLGFVEPYDTYVFGRTHQAGLKLGWDFENGALVRLGAGAHLEVLQNNQGFTPLVYAYGGSPIGPVTLRGYLLFVWNDDVRPLSTTEEGNLTVFGADLRVDFPWFDGPLYLALAGYWAERSLFLAGAFELLHSTGGRGLTENFFGLESNNGTGAALVGAVDWPVRIWRGLGLRFFGMLAHVWSDQRSDDPLVNRDGRTYLKWGLAPAYRFLPWLEVSLRYDRVIMDMNVPELGFRAITPTVTLTAYEGIDILLAYTHYFYGREVHLRPNQVPGGITEPDEDVFRVMARASF